MNDEISIAKVDAENARDRRMRLNELKIRRAEISAQREVSVLEKRNQRLGLIIGGTIAITGLLVAYKLVVAGQYLMGTGIASIDLSALVGMFAYGHRAAALRIDQSRHPRQGQLRNGNSEAHLSLPEPPGPAH